MPCGLHCAISGILAGKILGFGTADLLLFFTPPPRSCCVVWLDVCLLSAYPHVIDTQDALIALEHLHHDGVFGVFVFFLLFLSGVLLGCVAGFFLVASFVR